MEKKGIGSHIGIQLAFWVIAGYAIATVLSMMDAWGLQLRSTTHLLWMINKLMEWPTAMITGLVISGLIVVFRWTFVEVSRDHVHIKRLASDKMLELKDFVTHKVKVKDIRISVFCFTLTKAYLIFRTEKGTRKYRLYAFQNKQMEAVLEAIRVQQVKNIAVEEKIDIQDSFQETAASHDEDDAFLFNAKAFSKSEKDKVGTITKILMGVGCLLALVALLMGMQGISFDVIFMWIISLGVISSYPVQLVLVTKKEKICPTRIQMDGEHIWIDQKCFHFSSVESIVLTSLNKTVDSPYPLQYYLVVQQLGEHYKYWLGSSASNPDYAKFCGRLEQAMVMYPERLQYK